jgi:hypothetical protein
MLGLDSFIFIDDNRVECAAVRASLPDVLTVELPANPDEIEPLLRHLWPLDHLRVTDEDRARPQMYRQDAQRRAFGKQSVSLAGFLAGLDLQVRIAPPSPEQLERTAQLTQRTNQFNSSGVRRTASELAPLTASIRVVEVSDRFGDYGLVGVLIFDRSGDALLVDSFLLSCRALGRGIEHRMLAELGRIAGLAGLKYVDVAFTPTRKNRPALHFLDQAGAESRRTGMPLPDGRGSQSVAGSATIYRFAAASAALCEYKPKDAQTTGDQTEETNLTPQPVEQIDWVRFAHEYRSVEAIQAAVRARMRPGAVPATAAYTAPRTPLEAELSDLWAEMLHLPAAGVDEDFFALGGHSLLAVQLLSRVRDRYDVDLSLDVVFGGRFTVAELAQAIETAEIERAGAGADALLAEIEHLSDEEARELLRASSGQGGP